MIKVDKFELNTKGKDYVVGDIHGMFRLLQTHLDEMGFNENTDRLFCVGDLVDRGPDSELVLNWLKQPWFFSVKGNHEQMAIDWSLGYGNDYDMYSSNGGQWFLDLDPNQQEEYTYQFKQLPLAIEIETMNGLVGIIHGDCPEDWALIKDHSESVALWGRDRIAMGYKTLVKNITSVYVGHTPLPNPITLGNVHYLDTGSCFKGGRFTIVCIHS